jgi:hypothetical protein
MVAFFKRYNKRRPTLLEALVGIFLLSLSLVGPVHAYGKIPGTVPNIEQCMITIGSFPDYSCPYFKGILTLL